MLINRILPIIRGKNFRLFRAYTAEPYDGIGQYILVTLTRSSISAALRARIATGDFNTGAHYPAGTPIVVFSDHGQLEVLSFGTALNFRGIKTEPTIDDSIPCITFDEFGRVVVTGWGTSDYGLDYSYVGLTGLNHASVADFGEGSVGKLIWESGSPIVFFGPNGASGGIDIGPWSEPQWTFQMVFKTGDWPYGGGGPRDGYASFEVGTNAQSVILQTGVSIGFSQPHGAIVGSGSPVDFDWHPNQWYSVKLLYDAATGRQALKVWETFFESEPAGWLIDDSIGPGDDPVESFHIEGLSLNSSFSDLTYVSYFDHFEFCI